MTDKSKQISRRKARLKKKSEQEARIRSAEYALIRVASLSRTR